MENGAITPSTADTTNKRTNNGHSDQIRDRLSRLVSVGTAKLYSDACKYMEIEPPYAATTHVVGHLMREVESSLRDVLRPFTSITEEMCKKCRKPVSDDKCDCGRPKLLSHNKSIKAILLALGVDEQDALIKAWKDTASCGHKYAHRDGLEEPRPVDTEFMTYWSQMDVVLAEVLDRFETQYDTVLIELDKLIQKTPPTVSDAKSLTVNFTNNQTTREYFFNNLSNPAWLPILRSEGIFKKVPTPLYFDDGGFRYPLWPPANYLQRMASANSAEVELILNEVEDTENELAKDMLLEIATELPEANRLRLMEKLKKWI